MPRKPGSPFRSELEGQTFGEWKVLRRIEGAIWLCRCSCGTENSVQTGTLKLGKSKSCGCKGKDWCRTHGMESTSTYNSWSQMLSRCRNTRHRQYASYGGRGITFCKRWTKFENFLSDMGEKPEGKSLDRINNDGDYKPSNCRWATQTQQIRNRRKTVFLEYQGNRKPLAEWADLYDIGRKVLANRIKQGWSVKDALTKPKSGRWGVINA